MDFALLTPKRAAAPGPPHTLSGNPNHLLAQLWIRGYCQRGDVWPAPG